MSGKTCYCHNCKRWFHSLGIMRHRAMHRDRRDPHVVIDFYKTGYSETYDFSQRPAHIQAKAQ